MESEPFPATQATVDAIKRLATTACTARRNCQTLFSLISAARDVCHKIHNLVHECYDTQLPEDYRWMAFGCFDTMLVALESILDECSNIPTNESADLDANLQSWPKNRAVLRRSLKALHASPFEDDEESRDPAEYLSGSYRHDDQSWLETICTRIQRRLSTHADGGASAIPAFKMLLTLKNTVYGIPYEPDIFETLVRLASSIYLLLGVHSDAKNEEMALRSIEAIYPTVSRVINSGDLSDLAGIWLRLEKLDAIHAAGHLAVAPAAKDREPQLTSDVVDVYKGLSAPSSSIRVPFTDFSPSSDIDTVTLTTTDPDPEARVVSLENLAASLLEQFKQTGKTRS
ncbi:hypothetical protein FRB93_009847 [Tulasnella sp. JGI-2019a]|nr:hypothetical protein FRB93_009847 [Tulasnella sp. JGI-2019a]